MTTYWLCTNQAGFLKMLLDRHSKTHQPLPFPTQLHRFYTFVHFPLQNDSANPASALFGTFKPTERLVSCLSKHISLFWLPFAFCTEQVFNNDSENKTWKGRDSAGDSCPSSLITPVAMSEEGETIQSSPLTYSIFDLLAGDTKLPPHGGRKLKSTWQFRGMKKMLNISEYLTFVILWGTIIHFAQTSTTRHTFLCLWNISHLILSVCVQFFMIAILQQFLFSVQHASKQASPWCFLARHACKYWLEAPSSGSLPVSRLWINYRKKPTGCKYSLVYKTKVLIKTQRW